MLRQAALYGDASELLNHQPAQSILATSLAASRNAPAPYSIESSALTDRGLSPICWTQPSLPEGWRAHSSPLHAFSAAGRYVVRSRIHWLTPHVPTRCRSPPGRGRRAVAPHVPGAPTASRQHARGSAGSTPRQRSPSRLSNARGRSTPAARAGPTRHRTSGRNRIGRVGRSRRLRSSAGSAPPCAARSTTVCR
jgi:hypothetical protein